jgi:hypothetical protein
LAMFWTEPSAETTLATLDQYKASVVAQSILEEMVGGYP